MSDIPSDQDFIREPAPEGSRLLILSTCRICGKSAVGSRMDGSLEHWESEHQCGKENNSSEKLRLRLVKKKPARSV